VIGETQSYAIRNYILDGSIGDGELPVSLGAMLIAIVLSGEDFVSQGFGSGNWLSLVSSPPIGQVGRLHAETLGKGLRPATCQQPSKIRPLDGDAADRAVGQNVDHPPAGRAPAHDIIQFMSVPRVRPKLECPPWAT
jgi:hypothetical protein